MTLTLPHATQSSQLGIFGNSFEIEFFGTLGGVRWPPHALIEALINLSMMDVLMYLHMLDVLINLSFMTCVV